MWSNTERDSEERVRGSKRRSRLACYRLARDTSPIVEWLHNTVHLVKFDTEN